MIPRGSGPAKAPRRERSDHERTRQLVGRELGIGSPPARRRAGLRRSRGSETLRLRPRRRRGFHGQGGHPVALGRGGRGGGRGGSPRGGGARLSWGSAGGGA